MSAVCDVPAVGLGACCVSSSGLCDIRKRSLMRDVNYLFMSGVEVGSEEKTGTLPRAWTDNKLSV